MKIIRIIALFLVVGLLVFMWARYYMVFGRGTKAGILNSFVHKGYLFKTYEGKIIQTGFKANVQSIEFEFSVKDEAVAKKLMESSGMEVKLHYKEYFGAVPWRGMHKYIVDSVFEVREVDNYR